MKNKVINSTSKILILIFIAVVSILLCSANSFLCFFNDSGALNYNLTVAYAIHNGMVPYRDVFTQTGPIMNLFFVFVTLFDDPYAIVFVLEFQMACIFAYFVYRISNKFLQNDFIALITTGLVTFITYTSSAFLLGGTIEELLLPIFAYFIFCFCELVHDKKQISIFRAICLGVNFAIVLWSNICLLLLPIILMVAGTITSIKNKSIKNFINKILIALGVNIFFALIVIWYLFINNAFSDFVSSYFMLEINMIDALLYLIKNPLLLILSLVGMIVVFVKYRRKFLSLFVVYCVYLLGLITLAQNITECLTLSVFALFGVVFIMQWLTEGKFKEKVTTATMYIIAIISIFYCATSSNALRYMDKSSYDFPHYAITSKINEYNKEQVALMCYKFEDIGLFNDKIQVKSKMFAINDNMPKSSEIMERFDEEVKSKTVDFILTDKTTYLENKEVFTDNYTVVTEQNYNKTNDYLTTEITLVLLKKL